MVSSLVARKQKLDLEKIRAALDIPCPKCGHAITPAEVRWLGFETMVCPKCGERFSSSSLLHFPPH